MSTLRDPQGVVLSFCIGLTFSLSGFSQEPPPSASQDPHLWVLDAFGEIHVLPPFTPTPTPPGPTPTPTPTAAWPVEAVFGEVGTFHELVDACSFYDITDCNGRVIAQVGEAVERILYIMLAHYAEQKVMVVTERDVCGWGFGGQRLYSQVAVWVTEIPDLCSPSGGCSYPHDATGVFEGWLSNYIGAVDGCSYYEIRDCTGNPVVCVGETSQEALVPYLGRYVVVSTDIGVCGAGIGGQDLYGPVVMEIEAVDPPCLYPILSP